MKDGFAKKLEPMVAAKNKDLASGPALKTYSDKEMT